MSDKLFLVKPGFLDEEQGPFYCPDSLAVEGMLGFYPQLRELIDVQYVEFQRPREVVIRELGEENQGLPVIIIDEQNFLKVNHLGIHSYNGKHFLNDQKEIRGYISLVYAVGISHAMKRRKFTSFGDCR